MNQYEVSVLKLPTNVTAAGFTGSYVDIQGLINPGGRAVKLLLLAGPGTTHGTCGGSVQSAQDTAGTGLQTIATFSTITTHTAGGSNVQHGVIPAAHRYVRALGSVASGKDMNLSVALVGVARVSP